jgi:hypothetical protein
LVIRFYKPMKNIFLAASFLFAIGICSAQQKNAANDTAGFRVFPADTTVQPTSTNSAAHVLAIKINKAHNKILPLVL